MKDGRHVGLDFYDLLIEALCRILPTVGKFPAEWIQCPLPSRSSFTTSRTERWQKPQSPS